MYNKELYHHGIKGQKWGVRRYQNKDGSLTQLGRSRKNSTRYGKRKEYDLSNRDHSKSDKSPAAMFAFNVVLDLITLNPVYAAIDTKRAIDAGMASMKKKKFDKERAKNPIDKSTGFHKKTREMTMDEDRVRVNPSFRNFDNNTKNNCMLCTAAYDLRRRGYDVQAKKASYGYLTEEIKNWYPKVKVNTISGEKTKDMIHNVQSELVKQGDGARGNIMVTWKGMMSGHSMAYEVVGGQLKIIDAQANKTYDDPVKILKRCKSTVEYARLDNVAFSKKYIKEVAE